MVLSQREREREFGSDLHLQNYSGSLCGEWIVGGNHLEGSMFNSVSRYDSLQIPNKKLILLTSWHNKIILVYIS